MPNLVLALLPIFLVACAHTPNSTPTQGSTKLYFADFDVYGTTRMNAQEARNLLGDDLEDCVSFYISEDFEKLRKCHDSLVSKIRNKYQFAYTEFSFTRYIKPDKDPIFVTIDVVEPQDVAKRMSFNYRYSTQKYKDPDGLIQAWDDYQKLGYELSISGEISAGKKSCPAFHCIFGHQHPKLAPFEKTFVNGVAKNYDKLKQIFLESSDERFRRNAAFLLAYAKDGKSLVQLLSKNMKDESEQVRNNVMRVFAYIAYDHPELDLPMDQVIQALDFPSSSDRNKASAIITGVISHQPKFDKYKNALMKDAVPILLKMQRLKQPNNHDFAEEILKMLQVKVDQTDDAY